MPLYSKEYAWKAMEWGWKIGYQVHWLAESEYNKILADPSLSAYDRYNFLIGYWEGWHANEAENIPDSDKWGWWVTHGKQSPHSFYSKQLENKLITSDGSGTNGTALWDVQLPYIQRPIDLPYIQLPLTQPSPIILDLDGDGVETVGFNDGAYFDHDGNRFAEKTGWVGSDDALLVWDHNGNGQIDDGGELFGDRYVLADGRRAANGFEALKEFDSNGDGVVDQNDARWSELRLWQDRNGNGMVDGGEFLTHGRSRCGRSQFGLHQPEPHRRQRQRA